MTNELDVATSDGRTLHVYDTAPLQHARLVVVWLHGTPNIGAPPEPLFPESGRLGIRWVSYDRPGYGGSTRHPKRDVASAASDVATLADSLGISQFSAMGHSGGGPHALACAALLPDRVHGVVAASSLAPYQAEGLDWFADMAPAGVAELRAATRGRAELKHHLATTDFDPELFTPADHAALLGAWSWLGTVAEQGSATDRGGMVDDDLSLVTPWGFDPTEIRSPVLFLHGDQDRIAPSSHGKWLASHTSRSELWLRPDHGHVSILHSAEAALTWLREIAEGA